MDEKNFLDYFKKTIEEFKINPFLIKSLYNELLEKFGKQNWWPIIYNREEPEIEIIFGAILTQNTSWKQVEKSLKNLAENNLINKNYLKVFEKKREFLEELIRPSGFPKRKAETIYNTLKWYFKNKEEIKNKKIKELRSELLKIKGIGKETADSIILYAFNKPVFVVDTYTKRLLKERFSIESKNYDKIRILFEGSFFDEKDKVEIFKEFHALIVEYGKLKRKVKN